MFAESQPPVQPGFRAWGAADPEIASNDSPTGSKDSQFRPRPLKKQVRSPLLEGGKRRTLVVYVFADTDTEYWNNFMYFVREGMKLGPDEVMGDTQYMIIIQSENPSTEVRRTQNAYI